MGPWIPLESDSAIFTEYAQELSPQSIEFRDLLSFDPSVLGEWADPALDAHALV